MQAGFSYFLLTPCIQQSILFDFIRNKSRAYHTHIGSIDNTNTVSCHESTREEREQEREREKNKNFI